MDLTLASTPASVGWTHYLALCGGEGLTVPRTEGTTDEQPSSGTLRGEDWLGAGFLGEALGVVQRSWGTGFAHPGALSAVGEASLAGRD